MEVWHLAFFRFHLDHFSKIINAVNLRSVLLVFLNKGP